MEASPWKRFFDHWPADLARRGILVTAFGEQILFDNFQVTDGLLLVWRKMPDTVGARQVILSYDQINALKIVDVVKAQAYEAMGFEPVKKK
ncbi:MAG: hypothetical protein HQ581_17575 [Planctomycetes bacterium]|nr:hypothetical protein [Planctomycetota bacterium]